MAILTFPSIVPDTIDFGIKYNTQVSSSDISGMTQRVELPGARWGGVLNFVNMEPEDSAALKAFLLRLRGSSGSFFYGDISHSSPFNTVTGSLTIESVSTPSTIRVTTSSGSFSAGDYIQIGADDERELKMIVSSTNISGTTYDLTIEPIIRRTDYIGLSVVYTNPRGVFFLVSDDQARWATRGKAYLSDITVEFVELFL